VPRNSPGTPWKPVAIVLAIVLLVVLVLVALVAAGVMNLGWSLL